MKAMIISVSSALLKGSATNTNAAFLSRELTALGFDITESIMIHDDEEKLLEVLKKAEAQVEFIVLVGGLGPDDNDIVKTTLAKHLDLDLVLDEETQNRIMTYHKNSSLVMPKNNQLQALTLLGSTPLVNVTGLALGMFHQTDTHHYLLLPGPADELVPMFIENTRPLLLEELTDKPCVSNRIIRLYGLTMAQAHQELGEIATTVENPIIQIYPADIEIEVQLTARADTEEDCHQLIAKAEKQIEERLGEYIIGYGTENLPNIVRQLLKENKLKLTAAESLTGGAFLSEVSSLFEAGLILDGGIVTYSEVTKHDALGVTKKTIETHGVVSAECAFEMAEKSLKMFDADIAVSLSGVAGPSSLENEIPGTVWVGIAVKDQKTFARKFHFGYKRNLNRRHSVWSAFNMVRKHILEEEIEEVVYKK